MKAYVARVERESPPGFEEFQSIRDAAVISVEMHEGHLSEDPGCPCPAPRGRDIVAAVDDFHRKARALGVPIIHVRSVLRKSGIDDIKGVKSAWRMLYELGGTVIPNQARRRARLRRLSSITARSRISPRTRYW